MNAMVFCSFTGFSSLWLALSKADLSGPCGSIMLWSEKPPGTKPSSLASYWPKISPMNSDMMFMWYQGGRKECSATIQRSGKMTKSILAVPASPEGAVSTVKIDGSG